MFIDLVNLNPHEKRRETMDNHTLLIRLELDGRTIKLQDGQQGLALSTEKQYRWKATDADLVELIYALKNVNVIELDGQPADIKSIAEMFRLCFGREIPNVYYTQMSNQRRKKDKTPFLNSLIKVMAEEEDGEAG